MGLTAALPGPRPWPDQARRPRRCRRRGRRRRLPGRRPRARRRWHDCAPEAASRAGSMTTGSSSNGPWQVSHPAQPFFPSSPARLSCACNTGQTQHAHQPPPESRSARSPLAPRRPPQPRSCRLRPIHARVRHQRARLGRSERYGATDSGAVSAGSNPVGGTGQRHKFEHPNNLDASQPWVCDLRLRNGAIMFAPRALPEWPPLLLRRRSWHIAISAYEAVALLSQVGTHLHGLSSGDFVPALGQFLGSSAGLSAAVITRLTETWQGGAARLR